MLKLDFYVQHLVRENALELRLSSGTPVRFRFEDGERASAKPIDHAQVRALVEEAAPPNALEILRRGRSAQFQHVTEAAVVVAVEVEVARPDLWNVVVRPDQSRIELAVEPAPRVRPVEARIEPRPAEARPPLGRPAPSDGTRPIEMTRPMSPASPPGREPPAREPEPASGAHSGGHAEDAVTAAGVRVDAVPGEPKLNHMLRMMIAVSASDLHLSSEVVPMVRRHGEMMPLYRRGPAAERELRQLLEEIIPERNATELRERNDTDFAHTIEGLARFRANYFVDRKGIGAVFRQIPFDILSPEKLGIPPKVLELCNLTKGLVLVTGPTGSGKSTTLATLIDVVNQRRADHIITIEDPIEFVHPNKKCLVNQREVGTHTASFKSALRAALREDPDIVLVGEMRDLETIAIAIETAETGHLVFGTLHTTSAPSTVDRIIDQFPPDRQAQIRTMLSESIRGVIAQVLCKKKGGGRVAAYEILLATPAVANLIREGKTFQLASVMQTGRALGMQTMNDHLLELVKTDKIEPEEAYMKSNDKGVMKELLTKAGQTLRLP